MSDEFADVGRQRAREASGIPAAAAPVTGAAPDVIYLPDERQQEKKKVKSGSEKRQRSATVALRLLPADFERLKIEAAAARKSVAAYLVSGKFREEKTYRPRRRGRMVDDAALTKALVAFNRAGSNQNQIARALNELLLIAREQSNARLASEVESLTGAIRGVPAMFGEPVAAIKAALNYSGDDP